MFMQTWDYNGFAVGPGLALLEQIFDKKSWFFLEKWFFCMCDRSAVSADINIKMLRKVVYNIFEPESIIYDISITPI